VRGELFERCDAVEDLSLFGVRREERRRSDEDGHTVAGSGAPGVPLGLTVLEHRPHLVLDQDGQLVPVGPPKCQIDVGLALILWRQVRCPQPPPRHLIVTRPDRTALAQ
jgi:hypothetical protein